MTDLHTLAELDELERFPNADVTGGWTAMRAMDRLKLLAAARRLHELESVLRWYDTVRFCDTDDLIEEAKGDGWNLELEEAARASDGEPLSHERTKGCRHKLVGTKHCLKCGWLPPRSRKPAKETP